MCRYNLVRLVSLLAALSLLSVAAASADIEIGLQGWGLRGGLSNDPDQLFVGAHIDLGEFAENIRFMPSATIGFGDERTLVAVNPDVLLTFPVEDIGALYLGGLFAIQWINYDDGHSRRSRVGVDDSDTELGVHALCGLTLDSEPLFFELNVGIDDAPDLKVTVGYTFRGN